MICRWLLTLDYGKFVVLAGVRGSVAPLLQLLRCWHGERKFGKGKHLSPILKVPLMRVMTLSSAPQWDILKVHRDIEVRPNLLQGTVVWLRNLHFSEDTLMEKVAAKLKVGELDNAFMGLFVVRRRESRMIERERMATGFACNERGI